MNAEIQIQQEPLKTGSLNTSLTPQQLYKGDPWLVFVKDKLQLDNIWNVTIFFVITIIINFSYTAISQDYHPTTSLLDTLHLLLLSFAFTSSYLIYLLLPTFMAETFDTLRANGVIGAYRQKNSKSISYESFVKKLLAWTNSRWWLAIIAMISVLFWFVWEFIRMHQIPLFLNILIFLSQEGVAIYIICFIIIRVVLLLLFINRLFLLFTIQVKPLHSDGSGGLGSLGYILWISAGMMIAISLGFLAASQRFASPGGIIILTVLYLVFISALVIGWLALPHHMMLQARNELLQPITDEYEKAVKETLPSITGDTATIVADTERLTALQDRYKLLHDNFPVWPLEITQMRRLSVVLILPALISILPVIVQLIPK
jgi:hypothetical protein